MIKYLHPELWAFDAEWVPDPDTGRRVYGLDDDLSDLEVIQRMWIEGGADEDDPRPYLKPILCRVVSIAALIRRVRSGRVELDLHAVPAFGEPALEERDLLDRFLAGVGSREPQLVGFNSNQADIPILVQRALACEVSAPGFARRPAKPWEGRDYFARGSDFAVDLKEVAGGFGRTTPTLHQLATTCRIPGKLDTSGENVVDLWLEGDISRIVAYNQFDAVTTYLVWLRAAHLAGHVDEGGFEDEQRQLVELLERRIEAGEPHHARYLEAWQALRDR